MSWFDHSLNDVGTREDHYLQLLEQWKVALENTRERPFHTEAVEQVIKELELGIALLEKHLATHEGYNVRSCRFYDRTLTEDRRLF